MIARPHITVLVALIFMVLVGCSLAYAIQSQSVTGLILSVVSLTAGIYCLHLLVKARQELEQEKEETA